MSRGLNPIAGTQRPCLSRHPLSLASIGPSLAFHWRWLKPQCSNPVPVSFHSTPLALRPIFMVDDQEFDRILFSRLLRETGVTNPHLTFSRGEDLIDALIGVLRGAPPPLLCFLDVKMAGMNGFDVLRWIRCQHACDEIPVVMLSSSDEPRDLGEAHHCGAQCYVAKFPRADQMGLILHEAERVAASAAAGPFKLPCNLLLPVAQALC